MGKVNYTEVRNAIRNRRAFEGNSCKGIVYLNSRVYEIYSYATLIYRYDPLLKKEHFNSDYYSVTTSKIQGIIADAIYGRELKDIRKEAKSAQEAHA